MAMTTPFERITDDISQDHRFYSLKRKSWNISSSPGPYKPYLVGSRLLGNLEKKRKLLVSPQQKYSANRHHDGFSPFRKLGARNGNLLSSFLSPDPFHSTLKPTSRSPGLWGEGVHSEKLRQLDYRSTISSTQTPPTPVTPSLSRIGVAVDLLKELEMKKEELEMENALLRQKNEESEEERRKSKEEVEDLTRKHLEMKLQLERYKQEYFSRNQSANVVPVNSSEGNVGLKFFGGQQSRSTLGTSVSRRLLDTTDGASTPSLLSAGGYSRPGIHSVIETQTILQPRWMELYNKANDPSKVNKMKARDMDIEVQKLMLQNLKITQSKSRAKPVEDKTLIGAFTPLTDEAEEAVKRALGSGDRFELLAVHEKANIEVTRVVIQCLLPGTWLNDDVINVYMELLKERELREPERFVKCHFFNTFFYNKLYKDKRTYDYKAIKRWTTQRKLGYSLSACDKILVPIHQDIHWCLAVINIHDKKLEYLDSLKGGDGAVLDVLGRYIADEVKDKDGKTLDVSTWKHDFPKEIPEQMNGCDCGMFMVKYADFHSRGAPLNFGQEHMEYFRKKMVWEILELKAT